MGFNFRNVMQGKLSLTNKPKVNGISSLKTYFEPFKINILTGESILSESLGRKLLKFFFKNGRKFTVFEVFISTSVKCLYK